MTINKRFEKVEDKIRYENFYERKLQKLSNEEIHVIRDYARISEKKKNWYGYKSKKEDADEK